MTRDQVNPMKQTALIALLSIAATGALAKLPAPSDEAKAKAAEAAAKTAYAGKVDAYKLCQSMDRVAASYQAGAKKAGKELKPAAATPPCADPGPYVSPSAAASAPAAVATAAPATAVAAAPAAKK
jgi:type II secretory pathway pseudopilin PulG